MQHLKINFRANRLTMTWFAILLPNHISMHTLAAISLKIPLRSHIRPYDKYHL